MSLRAVVFDLNCTLAGTDGRLVDGVTEMLSGLRALGLKVALASNQPRADVIPRISHAGLKPDLIFTRTDESTGDPGPKFCVDAARAFRIGNNQMVFVGDNDEIDAICAIDAGVLYINAGWSNRKPRYGVIAATPRDVLRLIRAFLLHDAGWYWQIQGTDRAGMPFDVRSLLPGGETWDPLLGPSTFNVLKKDIDTDYPVFVKYSRFLLLHLLTTIYLDGLHDSVDTWCVIPPSRGNTHRKLLPEFIDRSTKLFKATYLPDLIYRHARAAKAAYARKDGEDPGFLNQANTLHLNPEHWRKVAEKRVLVIDDYCTRGHSFECARQLLYRGGAEAVTCVSVGRYGTRLQLQRARDGLQWDPWQPQRFGPSDFATTVYQAPSDSTALQPVRAAFDYLTRSA